MHFIFLVKKKKKKLGGHYLNFMYKLFFSPKIQEGGRNSEKSKGGHGPFPQLSCV